MIQFETAASGVAGLNGEMLSVEAVRSSFLVAEEIHQQFSAESLSAISA